MLLMMRRETYSTSSVRRLWKSPLPAAVSSATSSLELYFSGASAWSAGAAFVVVAVVTISKDKDKKHNITFSSSFFLDYQNT